uniref:Uncharacterized protein n=1 Tax=Pararge aegeria TaxID=116150 RepID=S4PCJ9_9NEOP
MVSFQSCYKIYERVVTMLDYLVSILENHLRRGVKTRTQNNAYIRLANLLLSSRRSLYIIRRQWCQFCCTKISNRS